MRSDYVDLDRRFVEFKPDQDPDAAAFTSYVGPRDGGLTWEGLLTRRTAVILAEAGSGKTWEIEAQAERCDRPGHPAFSVSLEFLASGPIEKAISPAQARRLDQWKRSGNRATFFLDAVDEARLKSSAGFKQALLSFGHGVGDALGRAQVVLTSRISHWRSKADPELVCGLLGLKPDDILPSNGSDKPRPFLVVQLAALNRASVTRLAESLVRDASAAFIEAIDTADAWAFARRPVDVASLAEFWHAHGRLGSLTEMLRFDAGRKLREADTRQDAHPRDFIRHGAERLAAATVLCKRLSLVLPDEAPDPEVLASSLDPRQVLPSWSGEDVTALLTRPIFDPAAFGRVRFHHRIEAEYLAAQWLGRRVAEGCPYPALEDMLFREVHGRRVLIPSRAALAAWLAGGGPEPWRARLCKLLLATAPEALIKHGDPGALPASVRREVLRAIVERYGSRVRAPLEASPGQIVRLASADLDPDLARIIRDPSCGRDVRLLCLQALWFGKLTAAGEAIEEAIQVALEPDEKTLRLYALKAVAEAGTEEQKRALVDRLVTPGHDAVLAREILNAFYPAVLDAGGALRIIEGVPWVGRFDGNGLAEALETAVENAPEEDVEPLLCGTHALASDPLPPRLVRSMEGPASPAWLAGAMVRMAARMLARDRLTLGQAELVGSSMERLEALREAWPENSRERYPLQSLSERHPDARRAFVRLRLARRQDRLVFHHPDAISHSRVDLPWLADEIEAESSETQKKTLLDFASLTWHWTGRDPVTRKRLLKAAATGIRTDFDVALHFPSRARRLVGRARFWVEHEMGPELGRRRRRVQHQQLRLRNWWWLTRNIHRLRGGTLLHPLGHIAATKLDDQETASRRRSSEFPDPGGRIEAAARGVEGCLARAQCRPAPRGHGQQHWGRGLRRPCWSRGGVRGHALAGTAGREGRSGRGAPRHARLGRFPRLASDGCAIAAGRCPRRASGVC